MLTRRFRWGLCAAPLLTIAAVMATENSDGPKGENTMSLQPLFYRGELDDKVTTVANGARVNSDYASFIDEGPWAEVRTWEVNSRVHAITGFGIANHTFIEGETGLVMVDTGQSIGAGLEALKMKQAFSDKPVVAVIYTHHHYTRGTRAIVESYPDIDIPIFGHPDVDGNMQQMFSYLAPGRFRRGFTQFGLFLPTEGPDAKYGITEPSFDDGSLKAPGHLPVTHPVEDGEEIDIDGLKFIFHHAVADTEDSLIIHVPELDTVIHNTAVMGFMFPMYTLRGDFYRDMPEALKTIDKLRSLRPEYLIGCHGFPVAGRDKAYEFATAHRDALAYVYQQTVRGINRGLAPGEIAREMRLPGQLSEIPELYPAYVDVEYMVRGVYRGLIGWWANDTAELHPPHADELGAEIVQGFGGADALLERAEQVLQEKRYNLAAKLAAYVLADDPDNQNARQIKAAALRKMAYATPTGIQTRNFLLTEALQLEGKVQFDKPTGLIPPVLTVEEILAMPPDAFLPSLAYHIDASELADLVMVVRIEFTDIDRAYTLAVRHGAAEYVATAPASYDLKLAFERKDWAELVIGKKRLAKLIDEGRAIFSGDGDLKKSFLTAYADVL